MKNTLIALAVIVMSNTLFSQQIKAEKPQIDTTLNNTIIFEEYGFAKYSLYSARKMYFEIDFHDDNTFYTTEQNYGYWELKNTAEELYLTLWFNDSDETPLIQVKYSVELGKHKPKVKLIHLYNETNYSLMDEFWLKAIKRRPRASF